MDIFRHKLFVARDRRRLNGAFLQGENIVISFDLKIQLVKPAEILKEQSIIQPISNLGSSEKKAVIPFVHYLSYFVHS